MSPPRIFVSWPDFSAEDPETGLRLVNAGYKLILEPKTGMRGEDEVKQLVAGCVAAIVSTDPFTAPVLETLMSLRVIARVGVGTDSIDRAAADRLGIAIATTPGLNAETVADHTLALMLGLIRNIVPQDKAVKAGRWDRVGEFAPSELTAKVAGLVGAGTIGKAVARRLQGFGVEITFFDDNVGAISGAKKLSSLPELLAGSDVISLHVPLTEATRRLINAEALAQMKRSALLINTSRGGLVDQPALFSALRQGRIAGAAMDVFDKEPPDRDAIIGVPNLLCSSHVGGISRESIRRMTISATDSVLQVLAGNTPDTVLNADSMLGPRDVGSDGILR